MKWLEVSIDEFLSWNKYKFCAPKLSKANGILSKLGRFAPLKTCLLVYYIAWSYTKEINIDRVNKLQKRI